MKRERQEAILRIIETEAIETQQQLQEALELQGYQVTQCTLSRDIRDLHLAKHHGENGRLRYMAEKTGKSNSLLDKLSIISRQGALSLKKAQNQLVLRTMPGLASGTGAYLEHLQPEHLVGTIAGDDTLLIIMEDNATADEMYRMLNKALFPNRT